MNDLLMAFKEAIVLIFSFDKYIYQIIFLSLYVSIISTLLSALIGVPLGILLGIKRFKGRRSIIKIVNTLMSLPPVVAGLLVYVFISKSGPFGFSNMLFSVPAMIIAQLLLVTPIICGFVINISSTKGLEVYEALTSLRASRMRKIYYIIYEMKFQILGSITAGFGRAISEVGAVSMVGGNIENKTRVMTTYIMLQTGMGNFSRAIAVGIILILIALVINHFA
ncbi:MAG: ABC transporter permease, partial [Clostridium sp.]